jgi:hypothetical protein
MNTELQGQVSSLFFVSYSATEYRSCVLSHSFFASMLLGCGVGVDSLNSLPHYQRNTSAYTDPTPHYHFVEFIAKTTWVLFES